MLKTFHIGVVIYQDSVQVTLFFSLFLKDLFFTTPQVINAARTLAARPRSKAALDNMDVFKNQWETTVKLLTEAVDDITTIDDFLAVSGWFPKPPYHSRSTFLYW